LTHEIFEAHDTWSFDAYQPTLDELLSRAMIIDDIPFASLRDVILWKQAAGRPKDTRDIKLINEYLARNPS